MSKLHILLIFSYKRALKPGPLHYEVSQQESEDSSFTAFLANGCTEPKIAIAYLEKLMDDEYYTSQIPEQLSVEKTLDENLQVLRDNLKIRFVLSTRCMGLLLLERGKI